jgi:hypothetical protein
MYREAEILTRTKVPAATDAAIKDNGFTAEASKSYSFNLLPFDFPEGKQSIHFRPDGGELRHRFRLDVLPEAYMSQFIADGVPVEYVYADFSDHPKGIPLEIALNHHPAIACAYFTHALNRVMRGFAGVVIPNFLHDTVCWFEDRDYSNHKYSAYKRFSLRVQFHPAKGTPELLISYDGHSYTTVQPLKWLQSKPGFRNNMVQRVVYKNGLYPYDRLPDAARYHPEEVYPLLTGPLKKLLSIQMPRKSNMEKHLIFKDEIKWFFSTYARTSEFKMVIPHQGQFRKVDAGDIFHITTNDDLLEFGEQQTGHDIYAGFKLNGPAQLPPCIEVSYFYIYPMHKEQHKQAFNDSLCNNTSQEQAISRFTRIPMKYEEQLDIVFDVNNNPLETVMNKIQMMETETGRCYYAFLINPWTKFENDRQKHGFYYRVKEALLLRNIMMQNMDADKLATGSLHYFMPNLAAAMTGKLGGIPWRLKRPHSNELIVGFGVFRSQKYNLTYTGSSVCFANDGTFEAFDCFRAGDTYAIAATVRKAIIKYVEKRRNPERLVIHFYRKLSHKALKPVEKMLRELKLDIPVIILSINKSYSNNLTAFMHSDQIGMPERGTVINYRPGRYLLYLNDRRPEQQRFNGPMPLPLKISLWSNKAEVADDREIVAALMQQVYDFCFLYYRSVRHARLPVTIVYPEMLAGIVPYFRDEVLQEERGGRMMFL